MTNALTVSQLPQHLQALMGNQNLAALNAAAAGGISSGNWPRISIKGNRFRLQDPQGQEVIVPQHYLDVVIVDANPSMSKVFYKGAYDPSAEGSAPDCYSDNGVGPSARSAAPQCGTCAACPNNVWGSKITPTGSQVKACADVKKVAVLLAENTGGQVFELRIPGASLGNFGAYVRALDAAGQPAASLITRIMFDTSADYPKLLFNTPVIDQTRPLPWPNYPYITPEMLNDVLEVVGSDETARCIGKGDVPMDPLKVGAAATSVIAQTPPPHQPAGGAPQSTINLPPPPPPLPAAPVGTPPQPGLLATLDAVAPARRTRTRKAAQPSDGQRVAPPAVGTPPVPGNMSLPDFLRQNAAHAVTPLNPPITDAALDETIRNVMKV